MPNQHPRLCTIYHIRQAIYFWGYWNQNHLFINNNISYPSYHRSDPFWSLCNQKLDQNSEIIRSEFGSNIAEIHVVISCHILFPFSKSVNQICEIVESEAKSNIYQNGLIVIFWSISAKFFPIIKMPQNNLQSWVKLTSRSQLYLFVIKVWKIFHNSIFFPIHVSYVYSKTSIQC